MDEPLIYTKNGNVPLASVDTRVEWEFGPRNTSTMQIVMSLVRRQLKDYADSAAARDAQAEEAASAGDEEARESFLSDAARDRRLLETLEREAAMLGDPQTIRCRVYRTDKATGEILADGSYNYLSQGIPAMAEAAVF